jgi:hypothetical protein
MQESIEDIKRPAAQTPQKKPLKIKKLLIGTLFIVLIAVVISVLLVVNKNTSPIPKDIQKSVSFPVYYPDTSKLPAGFSLDKSSITKPQPDVVVYSVKYGNGKKIIFSVQKKPSDSDIKAFNSQRISLHTEVSTPIGKAEVGAIGDQSVTSLSTNSKSWIIITAPYEMSYKKLTPVLNALRAP